ncbi:hypothetical protein PQU92_14680 [Asticcacaulis sp. BYS171W]|uniref:Uncharacterized protein n=1 Tax=Asticcacaulis aquaticus TaxID=2984212 RepID=A0ABT5HWR3_9CAUL|nr:hypothetical protein [Asticcacaulis aquaticus]MDC7684527.1 hypothetical protein [Asticcacaulis aquaticus]
MLRRCLALWGVLIFVLATTTAPAYAQVRRDAPVAMPCHEMAASHKPAKAPAHDCDTACHCPVSQGAVADLSAPRIATPVHYTPVVLRPENAADRPSHDGEGLMRPPRLNV